MKTMRNLFLLCAGLSLFACSSDDDAIQFPEGTGRVEVTIVPPTIARAITTPTTGNDGSTVTLTGAYTVTLEDATGVLDPKTIEIGAASKSVTFENVSSPKKVTVSLNDGQSVYSTSMDATLGDKAIDQVPAYGETSTFSVISTSTDANTKKTTTTYGASVTMAIPVARLEVGTIKLETDPVQNAFSQLTVAGVYLDNLRSQGGKYVGTSYTYTYDDAPQITLIDYQYGAETNQYGSGIQAVLSDEVGASYQDFLTSTLPGTSQTVDEEVINDVYAYNFFGADTEDAGQKANNPSFKIYFSGTKLATESNLAATPRYAMITEYKKNGSPISLQNGKIYRITDVELLDDNIVPDESGQEVQYNVSVTVTEAFWTIRDITADWAQ